MRRSHGWSCLSTVPAASASDWPRAVAAASLTVLEGRAAPPQDPPREGKSDPTDAHLAVLAALRLKADPLPIPRAGGP